MTVLAEQCSCGGGIKYGECPACAQWWQLQRKLHDELKLKPWEYPACSHNEDDDPGVLARTAALRAASEARKR
jgi:hypothetical protein